MSPAARRTSCVLAVVLLATGCQETAIPTAVDDAAATLDTHFDEMGVLQATVWLAQFGTTGGDAAQAVSATSDGVFVAGTASGTLFGPNAGSSDVFLARFDATGTPIWGRQFGSAGGDGAFDVSAYANAIYVVGLAIGELGPGGNLFVRRYDLDGNVVWTDNFGGAESGQTASGVAVDASGVYVTGRTVGDLGGPSGGSSDVFLRKYDPAGSVLWTRQFGNEAREGGSSIAVWDGAIYVSGITDGNLDATGAGRNDIFVRRYDASGTLVWGRQIGTDLDENVPSIAADGSGVYVTGNTTGSLGGASAGGSDVFVRRYSPAGDVVWTRQFGTSASDAGLGIAVDGSGVYVAGSTDGDIAGSAGGEDGIVRKYDHAGTTVWTRQLGTTADDRINDIHVLGNGLFAAGSTAGDLEGTNAGPLDAFVARLANASPEGQLADIDAEVADLLAAGEIDAGIARSLRAKLDAAQAHLDAGNIETAIRILNAFINEVEAMIASGRLTEAEGRPLIDSASALITELGG